MPKSIIKLTDIKNRRSDETIHFNDYNNTNASFEPLCIYQSGVKYKSPPNFMTGPSVYDHYIIHYLYGGKGTYRCDGRSFPIEKGDAFLIRPYQRVFYQADGKEPYQYYWVGFNGTEVEKLLDLCGYNKYNLIVHPDNGDPLLDTLKQITSIHIITSTQEMRLISLLYNLFSLLTQSNEKQLNVSYSSYFHTAASYIRRYLASEDLSVQKIAGYIGIDRSHLYRVFYAACGQSVQSFILAMRVEKAKKLLMLTSYSISDIACNCGIPDPSYFSQLFKRIEGISPRAFRKERKETDV